MLRQTARAITGRAIRRVLRPIGLFDYSVIYRKDLHQPIEPFRARIPFDARIASDNDLSKIQEMTGSSYHRLELLRARIRTGSKCFLAIVDDKIVGFDWFTLGQVTDEMYIIALDPHDVYCMDAHIIPAFRGNAIHTDLLYRILTHAQRAGYRYAFTRVSAMHRASWKTHLRLGWQEIGTTYVFQPHTADWRLRKIGPTIYPVEPNHELAAP